MEINDLVLMTNTSTGDSYLVKIAEGAGKVKGLGVLNYDALAQKDYGEIYEIGSTRFFLCEPTLPQEVECLDRKAQIINPKDIPTILYYGNIHNASLVIEGGAGSGFLTCSMASVIRPPGKIVTYELREDFAEFAKKNLALLNLLDRSEIKIGDITLGIEETGVDTVVVDIPNPKDCVSHAFKALKPGGVFISYAPNTNQVESCVRAMREIGFSNVTTIETLQRNIVVTDGGTRPDFNMLGHTGYITFGYKMEM